MSRATPTRRDFALPPFHLAWAGLASGMASKRIIQGKVPADKKSALVGRAAPSHAIPFRSAGASRALALRTIMRFLCTEITTPGPVPAAHHVSDNIAATSCLAVHLGSGAACAPFRAPAVPSTVGRALSKWKLVRCWAAPMYAQHRNLQSRCWWRFGCAFVRRRGVPSAVGRQHLSAGQNSSPASAPRAARAGGMSAKSRDFQLPVGSRGPAVRPCVGQLQIWRRGPGKQGPHLVRDFYFFYRIQQASSRPCSQDARLSKI